MKAVRLVAIGEPLRDAEIPTPEPGPRDVLVQVKAAGICHSDVHYRAGVSPVGPLPLTLGHEIAGVVAQTGAAVSGVAPGERVCLHYLVTCGDCAYCARGQEQFCLQGKMLGKHVDGGYAEYVLVPARSLVPLPATIPFEQAAVLMCSSATSLHALRKARLRPGETVAVFGCGGLGMSALQLARASGALDVYAVDIDEGKLQLAQSFGAVAVDARSADPVATISRLTGGRGVDVALEVIGLPQTMSQAVRSLARLGRAVMVGIGNRPLEVDTYTELIGKEAEVIGASDHLLQELPLLIEYARRGDLDLSRVVARTVPLAASAINETLDGLERFAAGSVRTVIVP
ncbi:MAG: alcohol dehydrogenase catalytic domain-containing protein [Anaerolineae bacterium]